MSDEPSDAQKLIAEVIGDHRYDISDVHVHRCVCGADIGRDPDALDMHRGAEVDKALGGLTRQESGPDGCAYPRGRWVSGWTVTE